MTTTKLARRDESKISNRPLRARQLAPVSKGCVLYRGSSPFVPLSRHATDGVVTRSHGLLAEDTGRSARKIQRAMDRLKEAGLIRVVNRGSLRVSASTARLGVRNLLRPRQAGPE